MEIETKLEELGKAHADFIKANDARLKTIEEKGYAPADVEEKVDKVNSEIDKLQGEIKAMQTAMNRSNGGNTPEVDEKAAEYKEAFNKYARKGVESKALSVDSDPDGGFLVTPQMSSEIVKKVFESSPVRQLASIQTISTDSLEILEDLGEVGSGWVGEQAARPETTTAQFKKIVIPVHELYAQPKSSQKLLDDAAFNVEAWLSGRVSEKFIRDEATAFVSGNGVGKPKGFLSYASGTTGYNDIQQVNSGAAALLTADGLIDLQNALKEAYQGNASFLMKRSSVGAVRKLKDSQNQYFWQPGLVAGQPDMLLAKPLYMADDMPAVGAGNLAVAYGDFRAGYQIVDRIGIRVLRDPFTAKPFVLFYTTKRVGGGVKNFEAIKIQKVSA